MKSDCNGGDVHRNTPNFGIKMWEILCDLIWSGIEIYTRFTLTLEETHSWPKSLWANILKRYTVQ